MCSLCCENSIVMLQQVWDENSEVIHSFLLVMTCMFSKPNVKKHSKVVIGIDRNCIAERNQHITGISLYSLHVTDNSTDVTVN